MKRFALLPWAFIVGVLVLSLCGASAAQADSATVFFDTPSTFFPPPTSGPWGTLTLNLNPDGTIGGQLALPAGLLTNGMCFDVPGDVSGFTATGLPSGWSSAARTSLDCGTVFGGYNVYFRSGVGVGSPLGKSPSFDFIVSRTAGFSSVFDVISDSAYGTTSTVPFELEVATCSTSQCDFGVVGGTVPEPQTLLLLGASFAILAALGLAKR